MSLLDHSTRDRQWRANRIGAGLCTLCPRRMEPDRLGKHYCGTCAAKRKAEAVSRVRCRKRYYNHTCLADDCGISFTTSRIDSRYCSPDCYARAIRHKRRPRPTRPPQPERRDLTIEATIDAAYRRIQWERRHGLYPGVDPWQRRVDPLSAAAPDTTGLLGKE